jgi:hypothetical protein
METIDSLLAQFQDGYREDLAKKLGESGDPRALDVLLRALMSTQQMEYPRYEDQYYQLSVEERTAHTDRKYAFLQNWYKRIHLARALGVLQDVRALPELEKRLSDTLQLDAWGWGSQSRWWKSLKMPFEKSKQPVRLTKLMPHVATNVFLPVTVRDTWHQPNLDIFRINGLSGDEQSRCLN